MNEQGGVLEKECCQKEHDKCMGKRKGKSFMRILLVKF